MEPTDARTEYSRRLQARRASRGALDRTHLWLGSARLAVLGMAAAIGWAALARGWLSAWWLLAALTAFLWLGSRMRRCESARARLSRAIALYERGLERLDGRWAGAGRPSGARYLEDEHLYARDLDLFGEGSLFELLCAARTGIGQATLAGWLLEPAPPDAVKARQEAIEELAAALDFREDLAIVGEDARLQVHPQELVDWGERRPVLRGAVLRATARALSVLGVAAILGILVHLAALGGLVVLPERLLYGLRVLFFATLVSNGLLLWRLRRRTGRVLGEAEHAARELDLLAGILARIEAEPFSAPRLATLRGELDVGGQPPSRRLARLDRLMDLVSSRHSSLERMIGPFILWDLHLAFALEDWRAASGSALRHWLAAVGEMEAVASLAGYRYERPQDVFPELAPGPASFDAEGLGHPLLPAEQLVRNDVTMGEDPRVLVVSGSNMSGKSTLLRTVGIAAVLAQAGAPVRARALRLSPLAVGASIRIQDSLREGTSRFYAEITRLRAIMERAAGPLPVLFLIDEMLHGTNSHDRRRGSEAIVRGLVERRAIGLLTTHDLALTGIAEQLGAAGANIHFADHLVDGRMHFDYRIRPGVVHKSNAIELMRSVGLDV